MSANSTISSEPLLEGPSNPVGYVAIVMALLTGVIHLVAATNAIEFSQVLAVLFVLNGIGFIGGTVLYLTRFWQQWMFIVAALYAVVTILALFPFRGWGLEAFYMEGSLSPPVVITKIAEAVLTICTVYLYVNTDG